MKKILQIWIGKNLPLVHVKFDKGVKKIFADLVIHPIKRRLARLYVLVLQKFFGLVVIGITGSAGKTTTKEMIVSVLKKVDETVWSKDNIDPIFNIPTTILRCTPKTKYLVLEMGVEYPHEMDFYLWLVRPSIGVVTNIFPTHTLFFGDEKGVFKEKSKLVKNTNVAILNSDDKYLYSLKDKLEANIIWFKKNEDPILQNKNTARAIAEVLGVEKSIINAGLVDYQNPKHRLSLIEHKSGAFIFDDTYNSNPGAFIKTLNYFSKLAGKNNKIAVVGDMLELGKEEVNEHRKIANELNKLNFKKVFGVGKLVKYVTNETFNNPLDLLPHIKPYLKKGNYIFIKGSRSIGLDKLVDKLLL
ncbi:MAG: UDP-N-acetylmuramoyl-tripeptide-D-alanyl-D-alanine ligase [Candidatus Woesebacteria bacterium GW2011_GWA1_33_30]|uniref:UDP-N-acetylmuramoyl-tripeptide-D-alanyl-D-alanine ligase n=1 Tax=Candidatus Woesebacteria bacterium GW2011_GWA2_33_28 TaxID=1618561 RepID=A0A0G0A5U9_9BACT|nr:MAG: UDP-N-acetylmuramoyl-tripeptide-D-alanyl-D-alanine ligase [Candidatus Woesebacteria bacterium GW2011_GWA2_33_28]KKP47542.1 MAG: UDP-N-acetylmuramoyl-tripeptide-D-alanyl-D-alanine ligase [Candidatus Woesebacteria bacterium GW2011_GWA1_33_30]KKP49154.1 MAG: UDP-N-acetylmuramoyl-tripeptide-D-alanyl-D-alanine ligase [Microgenomates group bacterium GW2011_GWC1_33_32]KKP51536.1 MAG: UDP-N-acetylmuramoyl-tripeptide-D-alanyl-D-alanine ligase [Candidatus Woesebacteria bacterium GW2011_GWB1_33_38]